MSQIFKYASSAIEPDYLRSQPLAWYAVHVRSNFEKRVVDELTAKGLESYLPAVSEVRNWKDRKKQIDVPLFPGYVFTRIADCSSSRLSVLRTIGAVRILGNHDSIEPVPNAEVESIQRLLQSNVPLLTHPLLREGSMVRIRRGPLKDLEGLLVRIKNQARLMLSVQLLSRSVSMEVDVRDVEVIRPVILPSQMAASRIFDASAIN